MYNPNWDYNPQDYSTSLLDSLEDNIKEIARLKPLYAVFRDALSKTAPLALTSIRTSLPTVRI